MDENELNAVIGSFFRGSLPSEFHKALQFFSQMEYPCPDMKTFRARVSSAGDEELRYLESLFEPEDFAMSTAQNAFEKFHKRYGYLSLSGLPLPRASLALLADAISSGTMSVSDTELVFSLRAAPAGDKSVNVSCECNGGKGSCEIVVLHGFVTCDKGSCGGACAMIVRIPGGLLHRMA